MIRRVKQPRASIRVFASILRPRAPVILLSHPRSYSSLLCHLLNESSEIDGYGELQMSYESPLDLLRMRRRVTKTIGGPLTGRYVLDKVLSNRLQVAPKRVETRNSRIFVTVRQPDETIRSMVGVQGASNWPKWTQSVAHASTFYSSRLDGIRRFAAEGSPYFVFPAEAIVDQTDDLLAALTKELGLSERLTDSYSSGSRTGRPGFGDPSANIRAGKVVRDRERHEVLIPAYDRAALWAKYHETCKFLVDNACRASLTDSFCWTMPEIAGPLI